MKSVLMFAGVVAVCAGGFSGAYAGEDGTAPCPASGEGGVAASFTAVETAVDPIEHATRLLEVLAKERQDRVAARDRLSKDGASVEEKLQNLHTELTRIGGELQQLHCGVSRGCYPFCVGSTKVCSKGTAVRMTSTLMARSVAIEAAIGLLERNLSAGQNETDQIIAAIDLLEAKIVLVPYQTTRIVVQQLPNESGPMLETLNAMTPKETPEIAAHRVRVAAFLASPLPEDSRTAEVPAGEDATVK